MKIDHKLYLNITYNKSFSFDTTYISLVKYKKYISNQSEPGLNTGYMLVIPDNILNTNPLETITQNIKEGFE